jgi:hypothetical protein
MKKYCGPENGRFVFTVSIKLIGLHLLSYAHGSEWLICNQTHSSPCTPRPWEMRQHFPPKHLYPPIQCHNPEHHNTGTSETFTQKRTSWNEREGSFWGSWCEAGLLQSDLLTSDAPGGASCTRSLSFIQVINVISSANQRRVLNWTDAVAKRSAAMADRGI